jgi:hypothetical protein
MMLLVLLHVLVGGVRHRRVVGRGRPVRRRMEGRLAKLLLLLLLVVVVLLHGRSRSQSEMGERRAASA